MPPLHLPLSLPFCTKPTLPSNSASFRAQEQSNVLPGTSQNPHCVSIGDFHVGPVVITHDSLISTLYIVLFPVAMAPSSTSVVASEERCRLWGFDGPFAFVP